MIYEGSLLLSVLTNSSEADEFQQNWQSISDNFDLLFTTEYSIEQLKQTILQLAVMGKLIKQDSNDEPASALLEQITEEKSKLVTERKVKKSKLLPEMCDEEIPYEISSKWKWVYLQDLSSYIQRGKSPKYIDKSDKIVISQKCVRWNGLDISPARFIDPKSLENYEKIRFLKDGDILWNSTGTGTIGRASLFFQVNEYQNIVADSHVTVVRTLGNISDYIYLVIRSPYIQKGLESTASGTTNQIELNTSTVLQTKIPLPPIEEQKRIVEKVNQLFSMIERLQKLQSKLQRTKLHLADSLVTNALSGVNNKNESEAIDNIVLFEKPIDVVKKTNQKSTDQIDLFADESVDDDLKLLSLAAEITFQLHTEPTFGHLKLQKLIYLCQQLKHMDLAADFKQHAAGPYDPVMARYLDKKFKDHEWFSYDPQRDLKYKPLSRCNDHRSAFNKYFAKDVTAIYDLIGLFRTSKSDHIEIVATLFACWLRLLENKQSVTEEQLLKDFYAWSDEKKEFSQNEVLNGLKWMKQNSIVPL